MYKWRTCKFYPVFFEICKIKRVIVNKKCFIDYNPLILD